MILAWVEENQGVLGLLAAISFLLFLFSLLLIPLVVARLPVDFFVRGQVPFRNLSVFRMVLRLLKNLLGFCLVLIGIALLFLPGQGLLTLLLGIGLLDFPGKHRLQERLMRRRSVRRFLQWVRRKRGRTPFRFPGVSRGGLD